MSHGAEESRSIRESDLNRAVARGIITPAEANALWRDFTHSPTDAVAPSAEPDVRPRFDMAHLLWYAGALIIIAAMGLFATLAFSTWGGSALVLTAFAYALGFVFLGQILWRRKLWVPGGLSIVVAVTMAPLFVFGVQEALGWWQPQEASHYHNFYQWAKAGRFPMTLAAVSAGCVALYFYRFPFLLAPIALALWLLSMDLMPWLLGAPWDDWPQRRQVSLGFGLLMLLLAWWVDVRTRGHFAFWLHLFGLAAFCTGLALMDSDDVIAKLFYCLINIALLFLALFLQRRAYAVFGAFGVAVYLQDLASGIFRDSLLFPFALSLIGLLILATGLLYYYKQAAIQAAIDTHLPAALKALRPAHAR